MPKKRGKGQGKAEAGGAGMQEKLLGHTDLHDLADLPDLEEGAAPGHGHAHGHSHGADACAGGHGHAHEHGHGHEHEHEHEHGHEHGQGHGSEHGHGHGHGHSHGHGGGGDAELASPVKPGGWKRRKVRVCAPPLCPPARCSLRA